MRWAIIHLYDTGTDPNEAIRSVQRYLPSAQCRSFALAEDGVPIPSHPLSTYLFLAADPLSDKEILRAEKSSFVHRVLCHPGTRVVYRLTDREVKRMGEPTKMPTVHVGDRVRFDSGPFSSLEGTVSKVLGHTVKVRVTLRVGDAEINVRVKDVVRL